MPKMFLTTLPLEKSFFTSMDTDTPLGSPALADGGHVRTEDRDLAVHLHFSTYQG